MRRIWARAVPGSFMRDPYTILGLAKTADAADIKKSFRKLAKKYHPDQSTEAKAKDKFAEISAAYEILGDEKKRASFDRGEIDAEGKPRHPGFEGFGAGGPGAGFGRRTGGGGGFENFDFNFSGGAAPGGGRAGFDASDLFSDLFGGATRRRAAGSAGPGPGARPAARGEEVTGSVTVTLAEAVAGAKVRVTLPTNKTLEINVPAGMEDGKQIRLRGQGQPSPWGGEPGDALVTVKIARHPFLRPEGRDLRLDLPLTLYEATLGAKVHVPTLNGTVELAIPPGSNGGRTLRLRGKGMTGGGAPDGDLLVTLRLVLPDATDEDFKALMRKWQADKPYSPRRDMT